MFCFYIQNKLTFTKMSTNTRAISETTSKVFMPFIFDSSYKGDGITKRVCEILQLPSVSGWSVVDYDESAGLAMVHYNPDSDMDTLGHVRGIVVDTNNGHIVTSSFGYTPTILCDEIVNQDGSYVMKDSTGKTHTFDATDSVMKRVFEGVVIRIMWYNGKCYRMTHKKLNASKSRWGSAKTFVAMFEEANGPKAEELFDTSKLYSSTCYDFIVVDPSLLIGTRQVVNKPYIVLLTKREVNCPSDSSEGIYSGKMSDEVGTVVNDSFIHCPKELTLEEANCHLQYGFYPHSDVEDRKSVV